MSLLLLFGNAGVAAPSTADATTITVLVSETMRGSTLLYENLQMSELISETMRGPSVAGEGILN